MFATKPIHFTPLTVFPNIELSKLQIWYDQHSYFTWLLNPNFEMLEAISFKNINVVC